MNEQDDAEIQEKPDGVLGAGRIVTDISGPSADPAHALTAVPSHVIVGINFILTAGAARWSAGRRMEVH